MTDPPVDALPGPVAVPGPGTMLALGAHLGAEVWWCDQVFATTGTWVSTTPEASVRLHLAELSRVIGEHGLALRRHLPRPAPIDPESWVRPPCDEAARLVGDVAATTGSGARLAVVHRVLSTWLLSAWDRPRGGSTDGSVRAIRHARLDVDGLRRDGEALLEALLLGDPTTVGAVHDAVARIEAGLVRGGGLHPPGPHRLPPEP